MERRRPNLLPLGAKPAAGQCVEEKQPRPPPTQLQCPAVHSDQAAMLVCVGVAPSSQASLVDDPLGQPQQQSIVLAPLFACTMPSPFLSTSLYLAPLAGCGGWLRPMPRAAAPRRQGGSVAALVVHVAGYHPTDADRTPPPGPSLPPPGPLPPREILVRRLGKEGGSPSEVWAVRDTRVVLHELGVGQSSVEVAVRHGLDAATGSHLIRLACTLWLFNCTGVPVSLRQAVEESGVGFEAEGYPEDHVPGSWVPPLALPGQQWHAGSHSAAASPSLSSRARATPRTGTSAAQGGQRPAAARELSLSTPLRDVHAANGGGTQHPSLLPPTPVMLGGQALGGVDHGQGRPGRSTTHSMQSMGGSLSIGRRPSSVDVSGLGEILEPGSSTSGGGEGGGARPAGHDAHRLPCARGIADSMETAPTFETPSQWPSMVSGLVPRHQRLRLQVRITQTKAAPGDKPYWSEAIELEAAGGAAVATLPSPPPVAPAGGGSAFHAQHRAAYPVTLTASTVPGSEGALALCLLPRYVLRNALEVPMQYKQCDTMQVGTVPFFIFCIELLSGTVLSKPSTRASYETSELCIFMWSTMLWIRNGSWSQGGRGQYAGPTRPVPHQLCVRIQEAGWLWSGAFLPDAPGDLFVKIRHRDRGITMLVSVCILIYTTVYTPTVLSCEKGPVCCCSSYAP